MRPPRRPRARINRLRKSEPALQSHLGITFYNAFNDAVIYFGKHPLGHEHRVLVLVSLDPHAPQAVDFEIPLWEWGLGDRDVLVRAHQAGADRATGEATAASDDAGLVEALGLPVWMVRCRKPMMPRSSHATRLRSGSRRGMSMVGTPKPGTGTKRIITQ